MTNILGTVALCTSLSLIPTPGYSHKGNTNVNLDLTPAIQVTVISEKTRALQALGKLCENMGDIVSPIINTEIAQVYLCTSSPQGELPTDYQRLHIDECYGALSDSSLIGCDAYPQDRSIKLCIEFQTDRVDQLLKGIQAGTCRSTITE